jgi:peptidoglycan/xylan/chitin deacetylase (PgdA/CDA1 family)
MRFRDRLPFSPIVDRPPLKLPDGARLVVWTIVNVEDWDEDFAMPRQVLSAPTGAQLTPDLPNWAWHEYGMRVGFWRMKAVLDRLGIRATLSCNGRVVESFPQVAAAARDAGWEFMGHGWFQRPMHLVEDQRAAIHRALDTIEAFTGTRPVGWLGPGLTQTLETTVLLAEAGLRYCADYVLDDEPMWIRTAHGLMATMPYSVELNDFFF